MTQQSMDIDHGGPDLDRLREYEVDLTPTPVVRQVYDYLDPNRSNYPTILDPCAGSGVFGMVAGSDVISTAIELRPEQILVLNRNYHRVCIGDAIAKLRQGMMGRSADLVITNPAFSIARDLVRAVHECDILKPGGLLVLLQLNEFGQRTLDDTPLFEDYTPIRQLRIPGYVKFRTGINPETGEKYTHDTRSYSWWVWGDDGKKSSTWQTENLPRLKPAELRWMVEPGTVDV